MRRVEELNQPDAVPSCPQCGHDEDDRSRMNLGQHRAFVGYSESQALSVPGVVEHAAPAGNLKGESTTTTAGERVPSLQRAEP